MADVRVKDLPNSTAIARVNLFLMERITAGSDESNPANNTYESDNIFFKDLAMVALPTQENRVLNGDMLVDQANESAAVSSTSVGSLFGPDAFSIFVASTITGMNFTLQRINDAPPGFLYSLKATVNAVPTVPATKAITLGTALEVQDNYDLNYGGANAQNCWVSFWVKSSLTGNFTVKVAPSASLSRTFQHSFNIASGGTWTYVSFLLPGDQNAGAGAGWAGLAANAAFFSVSIMLDWNAADETVTADAWQSGTTTGITGTTKISQNNGATFQITNVRVRKGSWDVGYIPRPFAQDLGRCQRHYFKTFQPGTAPAQNAGVAGAITIKNPIASGLPSHYQQFLATMRANPTITTYNPSAANANWRNITAGADATVSVDPSTTLGQEGVLVATSGTVANAGDILAIHLVASARLS